MCRYCFSTHSKQGGQSQKASLERTERAEDLSPLHHTTRAPALRLGACLGLAHRVNASPHTQENYRARESGGLGKAEKQLVLAKARLQH